MSGSRLALVLAISVLFGCKISEQTRIRPDHFTIGNPEPKKRDFAAINRKHKIIIAVFDTGIDYNHPELIQNTHFELNSSGKPISYGKDYLALDGWSSYRMVDTDDYLFADLSEGQKKEALKKSHTAENYDRETRERIGQKQCVIREMLKMAPRLKKYVEPYRALEQEDQLLHATHVAGLMTYGRPDFGLISYRLLPYFESLKDQENSALGIADRFVLNFEDAVNHAVRQGARIVNLSLGGSYLRPQIPGAADYESELARFNAFQRVITGGLTSIVAKNKNVLFIAAAGNDGGWSDNESRVQYPCGISGENILCVGALNEDGTRTNFTNVPLNDVRLVFAPGSALKSLSPSDRCTEVRSRIANLIYDPKTQSPDHAFCHRPPGAKDYELNPKVEKSIKPLIRDIYRSCESRDYERYTDMSGTSMATPMVVHLAAKIMVDQPQLTAQEVIDEIQSPRWSSVAEANGALQLYKLNMAMPIWSKSPPYVTPPPAAAPPSKPVKKLDSPAESRRGEGGNRDSPRN
jgi:subtilisin family serine protease